MKLADLDLLEVNARFMRHETYKQLVENLRRDGVLTSVPFAVWQPRKKRYLVLSGNHRVRAAIDAGIVEADVMLTDDQLPKDQQVAIQLAHNAIAGEDDMAVLKELYEAIEDVDLRQYAGLDDKTLELLAKVDVGSLAEANLEWRSVGLLFLPDEYERATAALEDALTQVSADELWLARLKEADTVLDALAEASVAHDIRNHATAIAVVMAVYERHRDELREGWLDDATFEPKHKGLVPLTSVLGTDRLPSATAARLAKAVSNLTGKGEIPDEKPWMVLEKLMDAWERNGAEEG